MLPKNTCDGVHLTGKDVSRFNGGWGLFFKWWGLIFKWGDTPWGGGGVWVLMGDFKKHRWMGGRHPPPLHQPHYRKRCRRRTAKEWGLGQFADLWERGWQERGGLRGVDTILCGSIPPISDTIRRLRFTGHC